MKTLGQYKTWITTATTRNSAYTATVINILLDTNDNPNSMTGTVAIPEVPASGSTPLIPASTVDVKWNMSGVSFGSGSSRDYDLVSVVPLSTITAD